MGKLRKNEIMRGLSKTLPDVNKGLASVGYTAKRVAKESIPIIEKGVSAVYSTMASGIDLGVKGVKSVTRSIKGRSLARSMSGGKRRTRRRRTRRHRR